MKQDNLKLNIIINMVYQAIVIMVPLITTPYITRILGADAIGRYSFSVSIVTYFMMFSALGTSAYGAREISRTRNDIEKRTKLFWEIELLTVITTSICIFLWLVFILVGNKNNVYLILLLNLVNVMLDISWFYIGIEEYKTMVLPNAFFKLLGMISVFIFVKSPNDLEKYCLIMSLSALLGTIMMWIPAKKYIKRVKLRELEINKHFKETIIYFIPTIVTSLYTVLDKTLIGVITGSSLENGYYEEANNIINALKVISFTSINSVLGSRISYLYAVDRKQEVKDKIRGFLKIIMLIGFGAGAFLASVADKLVVWYMGQGFDRAALFIRYMSPLIIIVGISNCLGAMFYTPAGLRKESAKYIMAGAVTNVILNIVLINLLSGIGAIISTLIAESIITFLYVRNSRGLICFGWIVQNSWKKLLAAALMIVLTCAINVRLYNSFMTLIILFSIGVGIYIVSLIILRDDTMDSFLLYIKSKKCRRKKYG